jgi:signal transduction histidine kinase
MAENKPNPADSRETRTPRRVVILTAMLAAVSLSHYYTGFRIEQIHDVYTRLYYIPIILGAFWFGKRGGAATAAAAAALFLPHVFFQWSVHAAHGHFSQYIEMGMFIVIGIVTGALADMENAQRRRARDAYKRLESSFEQAREAARMAAIGHLSAGIAHEVRNPLSGIKGAMEILKTELDEQHPKYCFVGIIEKEISRLEALVTEFLRFARPPAPETAPDNLNRVALSVMELANKHLTNNRVRVGMELADDVPTSFIDSNQVKQVILNLILNAEQAMPDGGALTVSTRAEDGWLAVDVSDTGEGIPEERIEDIFSPFFTTRPGGTGLGLAVSRRIARAHGGDITVVSRRGQGTTFTVKLPIRNEAPENDDENSAR